MPGWPPNVARYVECQLWYHKDAKQQSNLCKACTQLKWKLSARKKEHDRLSQTEKQRSDASSQYPFEYLSPDSKKVKVSNMHAQDDSRSEFTGETCREEN